MGDTFPNHNINAYYGNPTFYYIRTLDPLKGLEVRAGFGQGLVAGCRHIINLR